MSSDGPYGRHGFNANAGGYGGGASYGGSAGGYASPSYGGQSYGGAASYSAPAAQGGGYGAQYGQYGGGSEAYQVRCNIVVVDNDATSWAFALLLSGVIARREFAIPDSFV